MSHFKFYSAHLLIDSTGLKFLGEGEWKRKKHQPEYRRQWRKLHIGKLSLKSKHVFFSELV